MRVLLIRHAVAETRDLRRWPDDALRPLTNEGAAKYFLAARGLRKIVPPVDLHLSSPYARAWQTAGILSLEGDWPEAQLSDALVPDARAWEAVGAIRERAGGVVAVVGHEPNLSGIASILATGDAEVLAPFLQEGSVACIECDPNLTPASGRISWVLTRGILRAVRQKRKLDELVPELRVSPG